MKIIGIVGARPNFIKMAPLCRAFAAVKSIDFKIVHTGQHYDADMSDVFFNELDLPEPDYRLDVGSGSHTAQTALVMLAFEPVLQQEQPDLLIVVGDVNSTLACALTAAKQHIPVAHIEAGLRSFDKTMPEEINRILTDHISEMLFVTEESGIQNLIKEGIPTEKIHFAGNLMIDNLTHCLNRPGKVRRVQELDLNNEPFILLTMHRPGNVDSRQSVIRLIGLLKQLSCRIKIIFPAHPRTVAQIKAFNLWDDFQSLPNVVVLRPQGYLSFLALMQHCALILTDSGGVQEEATFLGVPCITLRNSTERPVTIKTGTNYLVPDWDENAVVVLVDKVLAGGSKKGTIPALWDGRTAERIVAVIRMKYKSKPV